MSTERTVPALAVQNRYELIHLDIKTANLNIKKDEDILVKLPEEFEQYDEEGKLLVSNLRKSFYGLKQSIGSGKELGFKIVFHVCLIVRMIEGEIKSLVACGSMIQWFEIALDN